MSQGLTAKQAAFVAEYMIDLCATKAAIRAGYSEKTAYQIAHDLMKKPEIEEAIAAAQAERAARTEISADMVLKRWWGIATADTNGLMSYRRANCRHCWGDDFQYQWIDSVEWNRACDQAMKAAGDSADFTFPSDDGGYGFKPMRAPHPDCPHCEGVGMGYAHFEDTRTVQGPAALLFAGVKQTKDGVEIKVHDQAKALENVARHLGMFVDKSEVEVKHAYSDLSDDELDEETERLKAKLKPKT